MQAETSFRARTARLTDLKHVTWASHVRIIFEDRLDPVCIIELVAGQNAVLAVDLEEGDWNHQGARELEGVILSEGKIVRHFEGSQRSGPIPARWLLKGAAPIAITAKAKTQRRHARIADPSWVDRGRFGAAPGSRRRKAGLARFD